MPKFDCRFNNATYAQPCDRCPGGCQQAFPEMVLYDRNHCDPVVLVKRLEILNAVKANLARHSCTTEGIDNAIRVVEDLLGEHLPELPKERLL